jgi:hypothetical protein
MCFHFSSGQKCAERALTNQFGEEQEQGVLKNVVLRLNLDSELNSLRLDDVFLLSQKEE